MRTNRKWVLARRPTGIVGRDDFEWREEPAPRIDDGQFLVRNRWLSCDAAQRSWMEFDTYIPALPLGEVMASASVGEVVESNHPGFRVGEFLSGAFGWQDYAVSDGTAFGGLLPPVEIPPGIEPTAALSLFGITGLTAYFGLLDVGTPAEGETVVVSAAAGAVGSLVCQIAVLKGCRVVGIAGGPRKCGWVREQLGAHEVIDYKSEGLRERIHETCPDGVDVFFDNVGGEVLDAVLDNLAGGARIALCGAISGYSDRSSRTALRNHVNLIVKRAVMRGFLVFEYLNRADEAIVELATWAGEGKLRSEIDVVEGLENAPEALRRIFTGENLGKQLVRIGGVG